MDVDVTTRLFFEVHVGLDVVSVAMQTYKPGLTHCSHADVCSLGNISVP